MMTSPSITIAHPPAPPTGCPVVERLYTILTGATEISVTDIPDGGTTLTVSCAAELAETIASDGEVRALILASASPRPGPCSGLDTAHHLLRIADLRSVRREPTSDGPGITLLDGDYRASATITAWLTAFTTAGLITWRPSTAPWDPSGSERTATTPLGRRVLWAWDRDLGLIPHPQTTPGTHPTWGLVEPGELTTDTDQLLRTVATGTVTRRSAPISDGTGWRLTVNGRTASLVELLSLSTVTTLGLIHWVSASFLPAEPQRALLTVEGERALQRRQAELAVTVRADPTDPDCPEDDPRNGTR